MFHTNSRIYPDHTELRSAHQLFTEAAGACDSRRGRARQARIIRSAARAGTCRRCCSSCRRSRCRRTGNHFDGLHLTLLPPPIPYSRLHPFFSISITSPHFPPPLSPSGVLRKKFRGVQGYCLPCRGSGGGGRTPLDVGQFSKICKTFLKNGKNALF